MIQAPVISKWLRCTRCQTLTLRGHAETAGIDGIPRCAGCGHPARVVNLSAERADRKRLASGDREI
jgi:hypothetical protein